MLPASSFAMYLFFRKSARDMSISEKRYLVRYSAIAVIVIDVFLFYVLGAFAGAMLALVLSVSVLKILMLGLVVTCSWKFFELDAR